MIVSASCTQQDSCEGKLWTGGSPTQFTTASLLLGSSSGSVSAANVPAGVMKMKQKEFLALKQVILNIIIQRFLLSKSPLFYPYES